MSNAHSGGMGGARIFRIGVPLAIATLIFYIFPLLGDIYALQLRELSAYLAEIFLRIGTLTVSRQGTILSLPGMTFDIIPACSGSSMLRTLLFLGILWSGIHPKLTPVRKIIATIFAGLIALLSNGVRLSILLWASYLRGEVIEAGLLHTLIGVSAFAVALPGFFMITEALATRQKTDRPAASPSSNILAFTLVLMFMAYLPVLSACALAWKGTVYNHNDQFGYLFFLVGIGAWSLAWRATWADHRSMKKGSILFFIAAVLATITQVPGPNYYILGFTLMVSMFAVGLGYRNRYFAVRCLPFQLIVFLSFPKVSELINTLTHTTEPMQAFIMKIIIMLGALLFFFRFCRPLKRPHVDLPPVAGWSALMTAAAALTLVGQLYLVRTDFTAEARNYILPYLIGEQAEWEGRDITDTGSLIFYERGNVINRQYVRNGKQVGVMIVPSDGNRKTIHTPEYCQTGLGWKLTQSQTIDFTNAQGLPSKAKKLQLTYRDTDITRTFIYWFGDEDGVCIADYPLFIIYDTWRKFRGQKTNWSLYVIWSDDGDAAAMDFLPELPVIHPRP